MFHARSSLIIFGPPGAPVTPFTHVSVFAKMRLTSISARQNRPKKCKVLSNSAQNRSKRPLNDEENCLPILTFEASTPSGAIKNAVFALRTVEKSPDSGAPRRKCFCKNATYINSRESRFGGAGFGKRGANCESAIGNPHGYNGGNCQEGRAGRLRDATQ